MCVSQGAAAAGVVKLLFLRAELTVLALNDAGSGTNGWMFCCVWKTYLVWIQRRGQEPARILGASVGGLIFKVYMQEKLYPFNRIFFCISRVSAVL